MEEGDQATCFNTVVVGEKEGCNDRGEGKIGGLLELLHGDGGERMEQPATGSDSSTVSMNSMIVTCGQTVEWADGRIPSYRGVHQHLKLNKNSETSKLETLMNQHR